MITAEPTTLDTGLHDAIPADAYHALGHVSASRLCTFARSPAHAREEAMNPTEPTPALVLGSAIHTAVLEPAEFPARYVVAAQCAALKKDGERCTAPGKDRAADGRWFCGTHIKGKSLDPTNDGLIVLADDQMVTAIGCMEALTTHHAADYLLSARRATELTGVWRDPVTGLLCKLRADAICAPDELGESLLDLKSTDDASERGFWRAVDAYRYDLRAAFYQRGLAMCGRPVEAVYFAFVEKDPPHCVGVYEMPAALMEIANRKIDALLARWAECDAKGEWPGYSNLIERPAPPAWLVSRREEETTKEDRT